MTTKATEMFETIRNSLVPKYEFPYYALVRIHTRRYGTIHIPAPLFNGGSCKPRSRWAGNLPIASDKRDGNYYKCPMCGERSYYAGVCQDCKRDFEVWEGESDNCGEWVDGPLPLEYRNHDALKASVKEEILRGIDAGQSVGIISAEIVLSNPPSNVCGEDHSPFLKSASWEAQRALDRIESKLNQFFEIIEIEPIKKILDDIAYETDVPLDYIEGDIIQIEGTDEIRRYVNGVWQHKHSASGYDYWHPMARPHKGM